MKSMNKRYKAETENNHPKKQTKMFVSMINIDHFEKNLSFFFFEWGESNIFKRKEMLHHDSDSDSDDDAFG